MRSEDLEGVSRRVSKEVDEQGDCEDNAGDADSTQAGEILLVQLQGVGGSVNIDTGLILFNYW